VDEMLIELQTQARSVIRRLGLVPLLDKIRSAWRVEYEDSFSRALLGEIRSSDCVWDVGANVGYYAQRIAPLASHVVAFEPVQETFSRLSKMALPNATFVNAALADVKGMLPMSVANETSSLAVLNSNIVEVRVVRGDDLELPQPNVVKIDVEGFEWEVISGMQTRLRAPECRAVFCEVHFEVLERRGLRQTPAKIVKQLRSLGFATIHWLDASHISAYKS
jgi:FkbM family methyltransferase